MTDRYNSQQQQSVPPLRTMLAGDVVSAAAGLIGCVLARRLPDGLVARAQIVEAEAYHQRERGCHAYKGRTVRNAVMFGPPGRLYVYFTYGMWHCCNVVCEPAGTAAAVLLRAAQPLKPFDGSRDGIEPLRLSGPGLLCQGLELTREHSGANLLDRRGEVWLYRSADWQPVELVTTTRIGFSFPDERRWRFCWAGHPALSPARTGVLKRNRRKR
jgi:DNA-3-methyladenine glycosylase